MDAHHVVYIVLSVILIQIAECTDILVAYGHDVLLIRAANSGNVSAPVPLVRPPLHFPHGLAYRPPAPGADDGGVVFVSDVQSGEASVFALELSKDHVVRHREPVIKRSPQRLSHAVYSAAQNSLFVSSLVPVPGVSQSHLSSDISKHWSPEPSLVTSAQIGTVRGVTLDQCSGKLYWSETSNSSSSVSVLLTSLLSSPARALPLLNSSFYQGLHFDQSSKSLIIAITDNDNYTTSSCSFISYRETRGNNKESSVSESDMSELDYEVSVIAENISSCYPFALSTDQDYIYFSDWSKNGVMRLSKSDPDDLVKLLDTPPSKSSGRSRFGAYDVLALDEYQLQGEEPCLSSESTTTTTVEPSSLATDVTLAKLTDNEEAEVSPERPSKKFFPINIYQKDASFKSMLSKQKNKDSKNSEKVYKAFTPETLSTAVVTSKKEEDIKLPIPNLMSFIAKGPRQEIKHKEIRSGVASTDSGNSGPLTTYPSVALQYPDKFYLQHAYKFKPSQSPNTDVSDSDEQSVQLQRSIEWFPQLSREELVLALFILLILCAVLFVLSTVLSIRQFTNWRKAKSVLCTRQLNNSGRAYRGVSIDRETREPQNQCVIDIEHTTDDSANGTTDLIIDLSQDDIKVNSDLSTSTGHRKKKKKTFGPKNGSIKHLISKSFAKDGNKGSSTGCPGLQSSDGVTLNIEDCCQMTLCETPCYTSVRKEGKGYRNSGAAADDDQTTLLDDQQHTFC